jgi:hypothetical protein
MFVSTGGVWAGALGDCKSCTHRTHVIANSMRMALDYCLPFVFLLCFVYVVDLIVGSQDTYGPNFKKYSGEKDLLHSTSLRIRYIIFTIRYRPRR